MDYRSSIPAENADRILLGEDTFRFACHSAVECFTRCCRNADMYLYPADIIRLKHHLGMTSPEFLAEHTITAFRENRYFPNVMLKMSDAPGNPCSFLSDQGCTVYENRPYSCRAYPLEPAMFGDRHDRFRIRCYVVRHSHCLGHRENPEWTAEQWMKDQGMEDYHEINADWAQLNMLFSRNPFGDQGIDHPAMKMVYMATYNVDTFRRFVYDSSFLSRFAVPEERLEKIQENDTDLLLLGFDWIRRFLAGEGPLKER